MDELDRQGEHPIWKGVFLIVERRRGTWHVYLKGALVGIAPTYREAVDLV